MASMMCMRTVCRQRLPSLMLNSKFHTYQNNCKALLLVSSSNINKRYIHREINTPEDARNLIYNLETYQRELLFQQLDRFRQEKSIEKREEVVPANGEDAIPTSTQLRHVVMFSALPFIGFGFLDNVIMILAGEYIDLTFGVVLGISTMAAAALGNLVSDVAGVGLAGYVEALVCKVGIKPPDLSLKQLNMQRTRWSFALGRSLGVSLGCLIGMFPLLFLDSDGDHEEKEDTEKTPSQDSPAS